MLPSRRCRNDGRTRPFESDGIEACQSIGVGVPAVVATWVDVPKTTLKTTLANNETQTVEVLVAP